MPDPNREIVRVEIEYDDGEVMRAIGEDAAAIWAAYGKALDFYLDRQKRPYTGPVMKSVGGACAPPAPIAGAEPRSLAEIAALERSRRSPSV
jgi:hypothetical protein